MGQIIGKIMPLPRGEYDATETYNILDIVRHNDKLWMAKVSNLLGSEPSENNASKWMMLMDSSAESSDTENRITELESSINDLSDNKVDKSIATTITIPAADWMGTSAPYYYSANVDSITGNDFIEISLSGDTNPKFRDACYDADILSISQSSTGLFFSAYGDKPSVDLTMRIVIRKDTDTKAVINHLPRKYGGVDVEELLSGLVMTEQTGVYVDSINGSDITGDGSSSAPWATIQHAINKAPAVINNVYAGYAQCNYSINVATGEYDGFVVQGKHISMDFADSVTINGTIELINNAILDLHRAFTINCPDYYGIMLSYSSHLTVGGKITINGSTSWAAIWMSGHSTAYFGNTMQIENCYAAIEATVQSMVYIDSDLKSDTPAYRFIVSSGAVVTVNQDAITTGFDGTDRTDTGGRVTTGQRGGELLGSIAAGYDITIDDYSLYTMYVCYINYSGVLHTMVIPMSSLYVGMDQTIKGGSYESSSKWYSISIVAQRNLIRLDKFLCNGTAQTAASITVYGIS